MTTATLTLMLATYQYSIATDLMGSFD